MREIRRRSGDAMRLAVRETRWTGVCGGGEREGWYVARGRERGRGRWVHGVSRGRLPVAGLVGSV
jgi:hypothetical protein